MAGELLLSLLDIIPLKTKTYNPGFLAPGKLLVFYKHFQTGGFFIIVTKHLFGIFPSGLHFGGVVVDTFHTRKRDQNSCTDCLKPHTTGPNGCPYLMYFVLR